MPPSISHRISIAWPPSPPSEPTTTLVLTSPENRFVDTRIYLPSPTQSSPDGPILPISRLQWAFAGTSSSRPLSPDANANTTNHTDDGAVTGTHSTWTHWLDSKTPFSKVHEVFDQGDCYPLSNGTTLEKGKMVNEDSGKVEVYEEVWGEGEISGDRVAVVLVMDAGTKGWGMVVWVGNVCQGVVRMDGEGQGEGEGGVSVERWEVDGMGKWKRRVRIGDYWMPCGVAMECEKTVLGAAVVMREMKWKIVELSWF